ncbi:hypothetical protein [Asanoa sp. NPDC050611]|uniref:hypothetical protein n=1 Tax=Asanoa sp. NPDC050611 TaxID=3157098 RepID=UPI0033DB1F75
MSSYLVSVYHNRTGQFEPYTDGEWLTGAIRCRVQLAAHSTPHDVADWAFQTFNADVDPFNGLPSGLPPGEALAAWVYRLVSLRSLSIGDVVAVDADLNGTTWWACEPDGWRPICAPNRIDQPPLHVDYVRPYLRGQSAVDAATVTEPDTEVHRLCVFDLSLDCGHIATVAVNGWHPVNIACCDRLGGVIVHGEYTAYFSTIDYVDVLSERYEHRQPAAGREPTIVLRRRPRGDEPRQPSWRGEPTSAGRFPVRVGATWHITHKACR